MNIDFQEGVHKLIDEQLINWPLARDNYQGLSSVKTRVLEVAPATTMRIQFNPARIRSSAAKVDEQSIRQRKCFLCSENLPVQQRGIGFGDYTILVNPFPIFTRHLTIPHKDHIDQRIEGRLTDMLNLARALPDFVIFYNGPRCGASAPDHFHFQAGNKGFMPVEKELSAHPGKIKLLDRDRVKVFSIENYLRKTLVFESDDEEMLLKWFTRVFTFLGKVQHMEVEPMVNILCSRERDLWRVFLFPRREHRPRQFYAEGAEQILLSPASVDFGGVLITPREEDFEKLNADTINDIFNQVTLDDDTWTQVQLIFKV
ncbi:ATP adenylyltransferase (5',5'''-P-1,P-4-tetraphosphate phosphorylase II) [Thermophagus xiamenensis]|uniref:GDP-D-glucose phosphorylase 1 n=2 Tax=Thermophagus xiamenensis TaxID=385682 RepID=A0A1I1Z618_9BACT|nr:ATP adenylyltransferase (5',5'''-P-1,P-4-tetraphosphate phosphorylase II) [Thermophagus xiamenensis]